MTTVFQGGGLTFVTPTMNGEEINFFGLSTSLVPGAQVVNVWSRMGVNGQQIKVLGTSGNSGSLTGYLEGSSMENISIGINTINQSISDAAPTDIIIGDLEPIHNGLIVNLTITNLESVASRYRANFVLTWIAP